MQNLRLVPDARNAHVPMLRGRLLALADLLARVARERDPALRDVTLELARRRADALADSLDVRHRKAAA